MMDTYSVPIEFKGVVHMLLESNTAASANEAALKRFCDRYKDGELFAEGKYITDSARVVRGETKRAKDG